VPSSLPPLPRRISRQAVAVLCLVLAAPLGPVALAQPATDSAQQAKETRERRETLLNDFIHFVKIARFDVAADLGQTLLDEGLGPKAFVDLVERSRELTRFQEAVAAGMRVPALEPIVADLDALYRDGKLAKARDPDEIERNIALLDDGLRARQLGRQRLMAAGEYAMPQLLDAYLQRENLTLKAQVQRLMVDMGRQSIAPLIAAVPDLSATDQESVVEVLGMIPYRSSLPVLVDLYNSTNNTNVRQACGRSIARLGGSTSAEPASLYALLADSYYSEPAELTSFPGESHQLAWDFDPGLGLVMTPVVTPVFHEGMAMRYAERSLRLDTNDPETLALWIASNYSRSFDAPQGYDNPLYPDDRRDAEYFGTASGPEIVQRVLRRGIDTRDTPLVRSSISALATTAGPRMLWGRAIDGRFPLLEALSYQNRRVQFESALALGRAQPQQSFNGAERVIPLLAAAVRDASARSAIILTGENRESYDQYRSLLEARGFSVLPPSPGGLGGLDAQIAAASSIDLILTARGFDRTIEVIEAARNDPKMRVTPVLALVPAIDLEPMRRQYMRDQTVAVRRSEISGSEITSTAAALLERASGGPISPAEAERYAQRAIAVLRDLAISNNRVLNVLDASTVLVEVLESVDGVTMLRIAEILSYADRDAAQRAIMERIDDADGPLRLALLGSLSDSGKRFGNMLVERQIQALIRLAQADDDDLATAAVAAMGALEIENQRLLPLVLGEDG